MTSFVLVIVPSSLVNLFSEKMIYGSPAIYLLVIIGINYHQMAFVPGIDNSRGNMSIWLSFWIAHFAPGTRIAQVQKVSLFNYLFCFTGCPIPMRLRISLLISSSFICSPLRLGVIIS
jgi:hypothetical protein